MVSSGTRAAASPATPLTMLRCVSSTAEFVTSSTGVTSDCTMIVLDGVQDEPLQSYSGGRSASSSGASVSVTAVPTGKVTGPSASTGPTGVPSVGTAMDPVVTVPNTSLAE